MKKISLCSLLISLMFNCTAQQIVNVVFVGNNGVTENIKEAHSFIVVKKYPNNYKRLDYRFNAPLIKERNYSDSLLEVLQGNYYEYAVNGSLSKSGVYQNNLREKEWYTYNDTGKVILIEKYEAGLLTTTINPDTVKKEERPDAVTAVEKEAQFKKSDKDWKKYLTSNLNAEVAQGSLKGGMVMVKFVVNTAGECTQVHMAKSVEYVLDEEARRVIENSPLWQPAVQNGRIVNAYRRQPITFSKQ